MTASARIHSSRKHFTRTESENSSRFTLVLDRIRMSVETFCLVVLVPVGRQSTDFSRAFLDQMKTPTDLV